MNNGILPNMEGEGEGQEEFGVEEWRQQRMVEVCKFESG
jgi:hypothetical protein